MKIEFWDLLGKIAIIFTLLGLPSIIILYFDILKKLKNLLNSNRKKYISKRLVWKITFDYSNNNWIYKIWKDKQLFELKFTKASDSSIYIYNDQPSIVWVSIAKHIYDIWDIKNASIYDIIYDLSNKIKIVKKWDIVILKNIYWNYCALKILDIKDDSRNDKKDEITFKYVINSDWYTDFTR